VSAKGVFGAGIGSTRSDITSSSKVGDIFIHNGNIKVTGSSSGAGIGHGYSTQSTVNSITIQGGSLRVVDGIVGVGAENSNSGPNVRIGSPHIDCRSIGARSCLKAASVLFNNGSFTSVTGAPNLIQSKTVTFSGSPSMYVIYSGFSTQEQFSGLAMIHIASVLFPCNSTYEVTVTGFDFERRVPFNSGTDLGFGISVPSLGGYHLSYHSENPESEGRLTHDGLYNFTALTKSDTVYTNVRSDEKTDCQPRGTAVLTDSLSTATRKIVFESLVFALWLL
jgi:hypothetical protein